MLLFSCSWPKMTFFFLFLDQVLVVAVSTLYFGDSVPLLNGLGILIVIYGSYRYGAISINEKGSG